MKQIIGYVRISSAAQKYQSQIDSIINEVNQKNDCELVQIYKDVQAGFLINEKSELNKLIVKIKNDELNNFEIIVDKFERLSRDYIYQQQIFDLCNQHNINIFSISENSNTLKK